MTERPALQKALLAIPQDRSTWANFGKAVLVKIGVFAPTLVKKCRNFTIVQLLFNELHELNYRTKLLINYLKFCVGSLDGKR